MTPIEILAFIFAISALLKVLAIIFAPRPWINATKILSQNTVLLTFIYFIIALISGFFVLNTFTVIQVGAVALFVFALMGLGLAPHSDDLSEVGEKLVNEGTIYNSWPGLLTFLLIAIWILFKLFA